MSEDATNVLLGLVAIAFSVVVGVIANGWVLASYWDWFIVPIFSWAPHLTVAQSIGVAAAAGLFRTKKEFKPTDDVEIDEVYRQIKKAVIWVVVYYPLAYGFGWVLHKAIS